MQQKLPIQLQIPITGSVERWIPIPVRITEEMLAEVDRLGSAIRESRSEFIRVALAERIEREKGRRFGNEHIMPNRRGVGGRPTHQVKEVPVSSKGPIDPGDPVALMQAIQPAVQKAWEDAGLVDPPGNAGGPPPARTSKPPPGTGLRSKSRQPAPRPVRVARGSSGSSGS